MIVNSNPNPAAPAVTDWLGHLHAEKVRLQRELETSQQNLKRETQQLFAPLPAARNKWEALLVTFNRGLSVYEGIVTGLTVMRSVRRLFGKK